MTEQWGAYLASREWALLKRQVKARANGRCERCRKAPLEQIHHRTYIRAYHERLEDLRGLCAPCHEFLSGVRDDDPAILPTLPTQDIIFIYDDGHRVIQSIDARIIPAERIEQSLIDPSADYIEVRRFELITFEPPYMYEEYDCRKCTVLEGNAEFIRRVLTLRHDSRTGTFHDLPRERDPSI